MLLAATSFRSLTAVRGQLHLGKMISDLAQGMRRAWRTASEYDAALCTQPSSPEIYEQRLLEQVRVLYVRVAFALEALELQQLLREFRSGFHRVFDDKSIVLDLDEYGNTYPRALQYLNRYFASLASASSADGVSVDGHLQLLRVLDGTPRIIKDRKIEASNETQVRNALYETLIHIFPDTVRDVPIAKVSKVYKPDIGIHSLKSAVEFKFADTEEEFKRAVGGVFEDIVAYAGSEDWKNFYAVFYITDAFVTQAQIEAEFQISKVDRSWKPLIINGKGGRVARAQKGDQKPATV